MISTRAPAARDGSIAAQLSVEAGAVTRGALADERPLAASLAAGGLRMALAGGGTGGHIVPGLHLLAHAHAASRDLPRALDDVVWFTSGRAVEERVLASALAQRAGRDFERVVLPLEPAGGGAPSRAALALRTPPAVWTARRALVRHRSQVLLGLGGFTSLPAVIAARSLGIPVALLEINAEPGSATRWLARHAARVLHAWPATWNRAVLDARGKNAEVHRWIGPPLAPEFARPEPSDAERERARAALGFSSTRPLLVVLGGSQGSSALNQFLRTHAPALVAHGVQVLHQTGPGKLDEGAPPFSGYRAVEYLDPVAPTLVAATLVLTRGGASTLAEIAALRRPALVVPYPNHKDQHQVRNAEALGAGVRIVSESELGIGLRQQITELAGDASEFERARMSAALRAAVPLDAALRLYAELARIARA